MKYNKFIDYWLDTKTVNFRREFDQMYKDIEDPWECVAKFDLLEVKTFLELIFKEKTYKNILDKGCGLGIFSDNSNIFYIEV